MPIRQDTGWRLIRFAPQCFKRGFSARWRTLTLDSSVVLPILTLRLECSTGAKNAGGHVLPARRSDCTRWPSSGLCSLTDLEAILGRRTSVVNNQVLRRIKNPNLAETPEVYGDDESG